MTTEAIQALIDESKRAGYDENRALSDRQEAINKRKAEIQAEFQALEAEMQMLNSAYIAGENTRRAKLDALNRVLGESDGRDNPA